MLRRRILASAMASVMAIGSVAVVASAEETVASTAAVKTKADLEKLMKDLDSFRSNEIYDYGSKSNEDMLDAFEYADNVLADDASTSDEYTTAYDMVTSVYARKKIYSAEELKNLIAKCKKDYETDNICNEELGDNIWSAESFSTFEDAYEDAESVVSSSDSRVITDAYEVLEDAHNKLSELGKVTKQQFRAALKDYETALQKEFKYDSWRRGKVNYGWQYSNVNVAYGLVYNYVASAESAINAQYAILDAIKTLNVTTQPDIVAAYNDCVMATGLLNSFAPDETNRATKANVKTLLNQYHGRLVYDYKTTAAQDLYQELVDKLGAANVHNKLGDNYSSAIDKDKAAVAKEDAWYVTSNGKLISAELTVKADNKFYIALDKDGYALGIALSNSKVATPVTDWTGNTSCTGPVYKLTEAKTFNGTEYPAETKVVYWNDNIWLPQNTDWSSNCLATVTLAELEGFAEAVVDGFPTADSFKTVNKGTTVDLTDYIRVAAADIIDEYSSVDNHYGNGVCEAKKGEDGKDEWPEHIASATADADGIITNSSGDDVRTYATLDVAMEAAEKYLDEKYEASNISNTTHNKIEVLDTIGDLVDKTLKGSSQEWTLVWRNLKYALSDKYDSSYCNHTKKDVEKLIEDSYELAEKTGEAALFKYYHNLLVEARQDALDWVKAANKIKTYKDNVTRVPVGDDNLIADTVYHTLAGFYAQLDNLYQNFKYSFGEVRDYIAEVEGMVDDGDLKMTDALAKALDDTAYYLSTVETLTVKTGPDKASVEYWNDRRTELLDDNDAFTSDRFFQEFNRVFTFDKNDPVGYTFQYDKDTWITVLGVKGYGGEPSVNYTHFLLKTAYEALQAEVKAQTEPTVVLGDVDGNGVVNALDASAILKAVVNNTVIDVAVGDYNADGAVNALDAAAILKFVVSQA